MTNVIAPTPPPEAPAPQLSSGARTTLRVGLIVTASVLLVAVLVTLAGLAFGVSRFRVVAESSPLPNTLRTLEIDIESAPAAVRIRSERSLDEPRVDMRMINSTGADARPLSVSADGTSARVSVDPESSHLLRRARAGEITVVLPEAIARRLNVTIRQQMGVVFADADLDQLTARTRDGAVVLSGSARSIDIDSENGEIVSRRPISVSETFRAVTGTGDVSVEFAATAETVEVGSRTGDVVVSLPSPGPYVVDATTGSAHGNTVVGVPQTRDRDQALAVITARSDTGDVAVNDAGESTAAMISRTGPA